MAEPLLTDEQIAEWTSTHDIRYVRSDRNDIESFIPTHLVTAEMRRMRDEYERRIAELGAELVAARKEAQEAYAEGENNVYMRQSLGRERNDL